MATWSGSSGRRRSSPARRRPSAARQRLLAWYGRHPWTALTILLTILIAILATVFVVPLNHPFTVNAQLQFVNFPVGARVTVSWTTADSEVAEVFIFPATPAGQAVANPPIYSATGAGGTFSFTAQQSAYQFSSEGVGTNGGLAAFAGTYSSPLVSL